MKARLPFVDLTAIAIVTFAWGTNWYAITWQLGHVDPIVSVAYRFALAAALLFAWCTMRGETVRLSLAQHAAAAGIGLCTFAVKFPFIYWAEERVTSAVVAVVFAALAFVNLIVFRIVFKQRSARAAWIATGLGAAGVALLSWGEFAHAQTGTRTLIGVLMVLAAVVAASFGNAFARHAEEKDAPIAASTAWAMGYGSAILAAYATFTNREWAFDTRLPYLLSLLYLALIGSVAGFVLYYSLARRRGYVTASYISALTPPLAMTISTLFEGKRWSGTSLAGVTLVVLGQWLLLRTRKT